MTTRVLVSIYTFKLYLEPIITNSRLSTICRSQFFLTAWQPRLTGTARRRARDGSHVMKSTEKLMADGTLALSYPVVSSVSIAMAGKLEPIYVCYDNLDHTSV